jgi:class 3 adenylate cyclase
MICRMKPLTFKTSTFVIAEGDSFEVFHSLQEIPPGWRRKLEATTRSPRAATLLIADARGREEVAKALEGKPSLVDCRLAVRRAIRRQAAARRRSLICPSRHLWLNALLALAAVAALAATLWR